VRAVEEAALSAAPGACSSSRSRSRRAIGAGRRHRRAGRAGWSSRRWRHQRGAGISMGANRPVALGARSAAMTSTRRSPPTSAARSSRRSGRRAPRRSSSPSALRAARVRADHDGPRLGDLVSGLPRELQLDSAEIRAALESPLSEILAAVQATLEETPPELAGDIAATDPAGRRRRAPARFSERVETETEIRAYMAESPLTCVAAARDRRLEEPSALAGVVAAPALTLRLPGQHGRRRDPRLAADPVDEHRNLVLRAPHPLSPGSASGLADARRPRHA